MDLPAIKSAPRESILLTDPPQLPSSIPSPIVPDQTLGEITAWSNPFLIFTTLNGQITGADWGRSRFGQASDLVVIDAETPAASYVADGLNDFTIYLTAQNWEGDEQPALPLAATGPVSLPFDLARGSVFSSVNGIVNDAILWWSASATAGTYNINFETYTDNTGLVSSTAPALTPSGNVITLETGVVDPTGWAFANNASDLVLFYATSVSSITKDLHMQIFSNTGQALTQSIVAEAGIPLTTKYGIFYSSATASFTLVQTANVDGTSGLEFSPVDISAGTIGTPVFQAFTPPAEVGSDPIETDSYALVPLQDGDILEFIGWEETDGFPNWQGVTTRLLNSSLGDITASTPSFTSNTQADIGQAAAEHWSAVMLRNGISVLVYSLNGTVNMTEYGVAGNVLATYGFFPQMPAGSSTLFPSDFDNVVAMGSRFEVTYQVEDPTTGLQDVYGVIYDTATQGDTYTIDEPGQWVGTPFNDTVTYGAGVNEVNGGGGTDTFVATNFSSSQVSVIVNAQGNVVLSDGQGDVDTLERFSTIMLSDATITINCNVLTQDNTDGSSVVSTFNMTGEPYTSIIDSYSSNGDLVTAQFNGITNEPYASYEEDFAPDGNLVETVYYAANGSIYETQVACYCPGTLIATDGDVRPVEMLAIGDLVLTMSGALRPIKWIGRRSYNGRFAKTNRDILPICIKAGAIDDNVPARDLWTSPHHAIYIDGMLIEARDLVNDISIVRAPHADKVEYVHIELERHDVILAEGAWAETFLDDDSRGMFQNAHEYTTLYPREAQGPGRYCAPRIDSGFELETIRQTLLSRAAFVQRKAA